MSSVELPTSSSSFSNTTDKCSIQFQQLENGVGCCLACNEVPFKACFSLIGVFFHGMEGQLGLLPVAKQPPAKACLKNLPDSDSSPPCVFLRKQQVQAVLAV